MTALTPNELEALHLTASLVTVLHRCINQPDSCQHFDDHVADADMAELVAPIHVIQKAIMGQAAARAYPDELRLLGHRITSHFDQSTDA